MLLLRMKPARIQGKVAIVDDKLLFNFEYRMLKNGNGVQQRLKVLSRLNTTDRMATLCDKSLVAVVAADPQRIV